jgi:exosortase/archaeosortase family protein
MGKLGFWLLVLLSPLPLGLVHISWMWKQEQYHYLPALGLALVLLAAMRWDRQLRWPRVIWSWTLLFLGLAICLPVAAWFQSPWLGAVAWVLNCGAFLLAHDRSFAATEVVAGAPAAEAAGGQRSAFQAGGNSMGLSRLWPLTWLMLPLPMGLDQSLTAMLQRHSSRLSSYILDSIEVRHLLLGNILELPSGRLFVEEACSGVQSLFTLVFCAFLIVVALGRSLWLLPLYAVAAVFWAMLMNILRIVSIAAVRSWYGWDWSSGWQHDVLGYVCLGVAVLMLLSTDRFFRVLFFPTHPVDPLHNPLPALWNWMFQVPEGDEIVEPRGRRATARSLSAGRPIMVGAFAVLAVVLLSWQATTSVASWVRPSSGARDAQPPFMALPTQLPAEAIPEFLQTQHEQVRGDINAPFGENADIWRGAVQGVPVTMALSQPYPEWHDLAGCYAGAGWTLNDRHVVGSGTASGEAWDGIASRWITPDNTYAYVWYSSFNEQGEIVMPSDTSLVRRLRSAIGRSQRNGPGIARVAMVQMVVETDSVLPPDTVQALEQAHRASRNYLREQVQR